MARYETTFILTQLCKYTTGTEGERKGGDK